MRYHVTYLTDGEREESEVEARDAAGAVAAVESDQAATEGSFELLSVVVDRADPAAAPADDPA